MAGKPVVMSHDPGALAFIDTFSKNALADIVIDLLRQNAGNERLDGTALITAIRKAAEPVMRVRGDKLAAADYWEGQIEAYAKRLYWAPEPDWKAYSDVRFRAESWRPDYPWSWRS